MKLLVSVIIPTYNRAESLRKCIKSVIDQDINNLEIIVCDDGSTDNTKSVVTKLNKQFRNLHYIRLPHSGGPAVPRNVGIKATKGDWVAFLDSDDAWSTSKLQKQLAFAGANNLKFICTNANRLIGKKIEKYFPLKTDKLKIGFSEIIKDNPVICSSVMVKKELLLKVGGFPEESIFTAIEDYACWLKIALSQNLGFMSEPLVNYRDNPKNTIRNIWKSSKDQNRVLIPYILKWYSSNLQLSYRYVSSLVPLTLAWFRNK